MNDGKLMECVRAFGTPLYVFDEKTLAQRVSFLRSHLPEKVELCYAVKANAFIIPELIRLVDSFELCSPGEKRIYENLNVPWEMAVISGVYKDEAMIESLIATDAPIKTYTVESVSQFYLISEAARRHNKIAPVLFRLTSGNQFGLDAEDIKQIIQHEKNNDSVSIQGIQFFSGTQKDSIRRLGKELSKLDAFLEELEQECGFTTQILEYGPGLPVDYFDTGKIEDESVFLAEFTDFLNRLRFNGKIILELGRSIAASCGTYLTTVVDTKENVGLRYAIVDGGIHHLVYFGHALAMKQPPLRLLSLSTDDSSSNQAAEWSLCGSLCTSNDILAKKISVNGLGLGSIFAFENAGAYCMTEGMLMFLSRDLPKVAVISNEGIPRLVRGGLQTDGMNTPGLFI